MLKEWKLNEPLSACNLHVQAGKNILGENIMETETDILSKSQGLYVLV